MNIVFKAEFRENSTILSRNKSTGNYEKLPVRIVELQPKNKRDVSVIEKLDEEWFEIEGSSTIITDINNEIQNPSKLKNYEKRHFYALTKQRNNLQVLDANKVLGVAVFLENVSKNKLENELELINSHPNCIKRANQHRQYKKVGTSILDFIKKKFDKKPIWVEALPSAVGFYEKNGFVEVTKNCVLHAMINIPKNKFI